MKKNNWTDEKYFKYEILENGTIEIAGTTRDIPKNIIIPATLHGRSVNSIAPDGFSRRDLMSVVIPSTVKKIGEDAFRENRLEKVVLNEGLETIEDGVFEKNQLKEVAIPKSVKYVGEKAFANNNITYINFLGDDKQIDIEEDAFWYNAY